VFAFYALPFRIIISNTASAKDSPAGLKVTLKPLAHGGHAIKYLGYSLGTTFGTFSRLP